MNTTGISFSDIQNFWNEIKDLLVRKVAGKSLSSNDFSDAEKEKLKNINLSAQKNVIRDWNATSGDAVILNKPTSWPTSTSTLTNDIGALQGDESELMTDAENIVDAINEIYGLYAEQKAAEDAYYKLVSLIITGSSTIEGPSGTYTFTITPSTATAENPIWSIEGTGVSINQNGVVSVTNGTSGKTATITLKVTDCDNKEVVATKEITVSNLTLTTLFIIGDSVIKGSGAFTISTTPTGADGNVNWSITSGGTYASISSSGVVTAKSEAWKSGVTIKATSTSNTSISTTRDITVSAIPELEISGKDVINIEDSYTCTVTPTAAASDLPITWSIISGGTYATISSSGVVSVKEEAGETERNVTIQAESRSYVATKNIKVTYIVSTDTLLWDVDMTGNGSKYEQYTSSIMQQNAGLTEWTLLFYVKGGSTGFYHALSDGAAQSLSSSPQMAGDALNIHSFGNRSNNKLTFSLKGSWIEGNQWEAGNNTTVTYAMRRNGSTVQYSKNGTTWTTASGSTWNTSGNKLTVGADGKGNSPATNNTRLVAKLYDKYEITQSIIDDFFNTYK